MMIVLALFAVVDTTPTSHPAAVERWADLMEEERTAAELLHGYVMDGEVLEAIRKRPGIADVDYFAFRPIAAAKADA